MRLIGSAHRGIVVLVVLCGSGGNGGETVLSVLPELSLVYPSGLGELRDVKKNHMYPSQDFALSFKSWDLPLRASLSYALTRLLLPALNGQEEKLDWQSRDFLLAPEAGITKTHGEHGAFPCLWAPTQLFLVVTFSHVD